MPEAIATATRLSRSESNSATLPPQLVKIALMNDFHILRGKIASGDYCFSAGEIGDVTGR